MRCSVRAGSKADPYYVSRSRLGKLVALAVAMATKPSPVPDPRERPEPTLGVSLPTGAAAGAAPLRCIQRPTGEWFTFAVGNATGKDTPDATDLLTEHEARQRLEAAGVSPSGIDTQLTMARANPEISGDELALPDPVVGSSTAGSSE